MEKYPYIHTGYIILIDDRPRQLKQTPIMSIISGVYFILNFWGYADVIAKLNSRNYLYLKTQLVLEWD